MAVLKALATAATAAFLIAAATAGAAADERKVSGTIEINQTQVALLVSGAFGGGKLSYQGKTYDFTIGGLGVGGIGVSTLKASGTVYNLDRIEDFPGLYGQARIGWAAGDEGDGKLWLQNTNDVVIEVKAKREGVMLALGADGVLIKLDD